MAEVTDIPGLDPVVQEAQKRFRRCVQWENNARKNFLEDLKFANADPDNGWQWPDTTRKNRVTDDRPCLTINKTRQHNLQIINDAKQNKPGIAVRATGGGATVESAQCLECVVRYIERQSRAQVAYDTATMFQVQGGIGYIRVATDYCNPETFDQDIFIRRVKDPLCIFMDPDKNEVDGSDALFAFIYDDMVKEEFEAAYPEYKEYGTQSPLGNEDGADWVKEDHIRVAEYFRRVQVKDHLMVITDSQTGQPTIVKSSQLEKAKLDQAIDNPQTRYREIVESKVEWFLIAGQKVLEKKTWPGRYIPIVPVIGEETIIDGVLDRKGHTRAMKDCQRMYNYWTSAAVEHVALQGKTPYIGSAEAIEGYETYWNTANKQNYSILPYNGLDDAGNPIAPPQRAEPPQMAPAYIQGMEIASNEVMAVSGQYAPQMGQPGNERSAKAIDARQRQGDNSTYHYIDNLSIAIRQVGNIILDLIPKIYDTQRIIMIMAEDGTDFEVQIDPQAKKSFEEHRNWDNQVAQRVLNPKVGYYEVEADVGPAYATKREEAFNAFTLILTQAPEMAALIGDLLLKAGDFPMADEAAQRLKRMVPPQALGTGPNMNEQNLMQQVEQLKGLLAKAIEETATASFKLKGKDQLRDIDAFNAVTTRLKAEWDLQVAMGQLVISQVELAQLIRDTMAEAENIGLEPAVNASLPNLLAASGDKAQLQMGFLNKSPQPGARQGPNGQWYAPDPTTSSRYRPIV